MVFFFDRSRSSTRKRLSKCRDRNYRTTTHDEKLSICVTAIDNIKDYWPHGMTTVTTT